MKTDKQIEKEFKEWTSRDCFICKQKMFHVGGLVWICKNCEIIDSINHIVLAYKREE